MKIPFARATVSFRWHLVLSVAFVHLVMMGIFVFDLVQNQKNFLRLVSNEQTTNLVRTLALNSRLWLLTNDVAGLAEVVNSLSESPDLLYAMVISPEGKVLACTDASVTGKILDDPTSLRLLSSPTSQTKPLPLIDNGKQIDVAMPIFAGGSRLGWARLGTGRQSFYSGLGQVWRDGLIFTVLAIAAGSVFAVLIAKKLADNLRPLLQAFADIRTGKTPRPIPPSSVLEIEILRDGFDSMRASVESERDLRNLALRDAEASKERFLLAVNGSNDGIWDWNLLTDELFLSTKWKEMIGFSDSELPNAFSSFADRIHPDDKPRVMEEIQKYLSGERPEYRVEFRFLHKDGSWLWILGRGAALRDEKGKPYRMAGSHSDITATKEAEMLLRNEHQHLTNLLEGINEPIYVLDLRDKTILYANAAFKTIWNSEEVVGKNCYSQLFGNDVPCEFCDEVLQKTGECPKSLVWEIKMKNSRIYRVSSRKISWTNEADALFLLAVDITERHDAEEKIRVSKEQLELANSELQASVEKARLLAKKADAASKAKSEFLANISHEIRTPMNSIIGFADILSFSLQDSQQKEQADRIVRSARSLVHLLNDILDFSKAESGFMRPKNAPFSLPVLLEDVRILFAGKAKEKGIDFRIAADETVPAFLFSDEQRLRQILVNLTSNAIKFTKSGSVDIRVETPSLKNEDKPFLLFSVTDTGPGIPEEIRQDIFGIFVQAPDLDHAIYGGTGLGLAIAKQLAELLGGSISVSDSPSGKGSRFSLQLPLTRLPETPESFYLPDGSFGLDIVFEKSKVLIAEEIATNRDLLRIHLEQLGIDVIEAANGFQALALIQKHTPDLLLIADNMKGMNGDTLRDHLRNSPFASTPFIALAEAETTLANMPKNSGTNDTLVQPVSLTLLVSTLSRHLPHHHAKKAASHPALPETLPEDLRTDYKKILQVWDAGLGEACSSARKSMRMTAVKQFAEMMEQIGGERNAPTVRDTGRKLLSAARKFEIEKMIALFERIFESINSAKEN